MMAGMNPANPGSLGGLFSAPTAADPHGLTEGQGVAPGYNFQKSADCIVECIAIDGKTHREVLFNVDVYDGDHLHLHCPFCRFDGHEHGLFVRHGVRDWHCEPMRKVPPFPGWDEHKMVLSYPRGLGGRLQLAPVTCPWCKVRFQIADNVVHEQRVAR